MTRRIFDNPIVLIALVLLPLVAATGWAGDFKSQSSIGANFFNVSPACPAKEFPTFESIVPVPGFIDPFAQDLIPLFCEVQVAREGKGVKGVKGKFESELIVRDNNTGETESFPVGSGRFRTNRDGVSSFDFDLPAEIFADVFDSGDV